MNQHNVIYKFDIIISYWIWSIHLSTRHQKFVFLIVILYVPQVLKDILEYSL